MAEPKPPRGPKPAEDREVDYLICKQCSTPCYVFEMEAGSIAEALCLVCGNDEPDTFMLGEDEESEDD